LLVSAAVIVALSVADHGSPCPRWDL